MDRELLNTRTVYHSYIIDDGWHVPKNIIEIIDVKIEKALEDAIAFVKRQNALHKGQWLTTDVAKEYADRAWPYLILNGYQYTGFVKELGMELQEKYGVTQLEAVNILNGRSIPDYVNKYTRIKNLIPNRVNSQSICEEVLEEYGYIAQAM